MHMAILGGKRNKEIDHRDGNGLNNQRSNLRFCTHAENMRNRNIQKNNTSGYKGVSWNKNARKWQAVIKYNGTHIYLGLFFCLVSAARTYDGKARELYGEFARLNFQERCEKNE